VNQRNPEVRVRGGVSVVIPVFNAAETLDALVPAVLAELEALGAPHEVILVDDGSRDASWTRVEALASAHAAVRGVRLLRNYGQHNALLCGVRAASHELIVTMDDDLQHPPTEIPRLLERLDEDVDVVYGTPEHEAHGVWRRLASRTTKLALSTMMGARTARSVSAFRAFRTQLREAFAGPIGPFVSLDVLLTWATTRFAAVTVRHDRRRSGATNYTLAKLVAHAIDMATGFSALPLRLASWLGFACTLFGMVVLAYVVGRYLLEGSPVAGFPFLASIIAIFSGAQLFALGVIGEYLARVHFRTMGRPSHAIGEVTPNRGRDDR
jgi:undecaprenyl-phosphate 4-deoxy-4-formamido-L-arabinose transferase